MQTILAIIGKTLPIALLFAGAAHAGEVQVARSGYALQADVQGDGPLTVVFESGFAQPGDVWRNVVADLGDRCRCITYSRAGLGGSGTDGAPKTIDEHVRDLDAVMDHLAPDERVVLVGHSYGGLLATEYAQAHPDRVGGLVLVDPATIAQRHEALRVDRDRVMADDAMLLGMLPPNLAADYRLLVEQLDSDAALAQRTQPDVPVALLTSTRVADDPFVFEETAQGKRLWKRQHAVLFAGYARGMHRYFTTGHNIHAEDSGAVADAIRFVHDEAGVPSK